MEMEVYHYWLIAAMVFAVTEVFIPGFVIIWLSVGAVAAAVVAYFNGSANLQLLIFAVVSTILAVLSRVIFKKFLFPKQEKSLKTNVDALIGREGVVTEPLKNEHQKGFVKVGGEIWSAQAASTKDYPMESGTIVKVVRIEGVRLIVEPLKPKGEDNPE
ncbi:MAG: NfeD family protein [Myxococcota bacterium]